MAHLQHIPGDPRLVDLLVYELKSKGIFDQFRKECIADVDTRPAYQNLRQRVETSVSTFLSRQCWQPDMNKNQLREKLRKHLLDGNYLEQGVERIVDQVVNPKVASVFIPKVEDLVYNYLGITRKKSFNPETSKEKVDTDDLLPTDLEAVSPGSVKSEGKNEDMDTSDIKAETKMEIDGEKPNGHHTEVNKLEIDSMSSDVVIIENDSIDKSSIPLPAEGIKLESIPHPENSPPMIESSHIELEKIELPKHLTEPVLSEIPLPDETPKNEKDNYFKPINTDDDDDDSSSDSSIRRNMSPLTPIRNYNNENSCDAQQAFDDSAETKVDVEDKKEPSSFRFTIETKSPEKSPEVVKPENKDTEKALSYQFTNQVNINAFNTPMYDDSSNSNNLQIDYESDANSKIVNNDVKIESEQNSEDSKKDKKFDEKKPSLKSAHRSRDSHRHSSSKDKRSDSKQSTSRDSSRHDKNKVSSKDENKSKSSSTNNKDSSSKDRSDKKDRESSSSRHRSSHKSSSSNKDSKSSHKSSSSNRHSSKSDDKKLSSSSSKDKEKQRSSDKDKNRERSSKDSKSSSHRSSRGDKKKSSTSTSSSKRQDEKDKDKKVKKETDDHYSLSGRGNHNRRSTDRDSNDGSSSSKGSHNVPSSKSSSSKKESKNSSSKSENTSTASDTSPSDKEKIAQGLNDASSSVKHQKSAIRVETHLETPISAPPRLPFVPDITLKKPKIASNMEEARKIIKMRKFLEDEQKRMNQEAALLLEFQANVRPSLSQVYSSIPGPELEFACVTSSSNPQTVIVTNNMENNLNQNIVDTVAEVPEDKEETFEGDTLSVEQQLENIYAATYGKEDSYANNASESSFESQNTRITGETSLNDSYYAEINVSIERDNIETVEECNITDPQVMDNTQLENILGDNEEKTNEYFESRDQDNQDIDENTINDIKLTCPEEKPFKFFNESEKYNAEIKRDGFSKFYRSIEKESMMSNKMFLINCDLYEQNIFKDISKSSGDFEVVNYLKNGHLRLPSTSKSVIKDVNVREEITIPVDKKEEIIESPLFSPVKSECSFDLSSDYDAKLDESFKQKSRQQIMEIILGNVEESPSKMPEINYCNESSIESNVDNNLKRKLEMDTPMNNNMHVLTPNKMRKISESEQITSTTEERAIETATNKVLTTTTARSKYLGKARRVGLPRPRKSNLQNSPSSDKSIENYEENPVAPQTPNCKITQPRSKIQRYDTSDLYKPKLHYLSRRNHVT